jgi:SAM-dependent methyltransferase
VAGKDDAILDVGGGASTLVDGLLDAGYRDLTVLDIAPTALHHARLRLGPRADRIKWVEADVLTATFHPASIGLWHDRAVFHFLTNTDDRATYVRQLRHALRPGGYTILATFAEDGPTRCSGLDVVRYSANDLHAVFGAEFRLLDTQRERHRTPAGMDQSFLYCVCRWLPTGSTDFPV